MQLRKITQIATRRWLASEEGMELMLWLRENAPGVSRGDSYAMVYDAGVSEGYKQCLNRIAEITPRESEKPSSEDNPPLN